MDRLWLVAWGALALLIVGGLSILVYRLTTNVMNQLLAALGGA